MYRLETRGQSYCAHCDYIELGPRKNRILWLLLIVPFAWRNSGEGYR